MEESLEAPQNPVMIPEILEMILGHLKSVEDLKNCRLVHSLWDTVSTPLLSSKVCYISFTIKAAGVEKMTRFIHLLEGCQVPFPVREFIFCANPEFTIDPRWTVTFTRLLEAVADWVTHLMFMDTSDDGGKMPLPKDHPPQITEYPALTSLEVNFGVEWEVPAADAWRNNLKFVTEVLKRASHVSHLRLGSTLNSGGQRMTAALESFLPVAPLSELRSLSLHGILENAHLDHIRSYLGEKGPLTKLELKMEESSPLSQEVVRRFLEWKSGSLETLTLCVDDVLNEGHPRVWEIPPLPKLTSLNVLHFPDIVNQGLATVVPFSYHTNFPNLQILRLTLLAHLSIFFHKDLAPLETVTEVHLPPMMVRVAVIIPQVARIFPNLRKLGTPSCTDVLQDIYREKQGFKKVEHLNLGVIYLPVDWNKLLTGYDDQELKEIEGLSKRVFQAVAKGSKPPAFLKRLRTLSIEGTCHISVITVRLVLTQLKNLKYLSLRSSASTFPENLPKLLSHAEITQGKKILK